jgi:hypothetical protein
LANGEAESPSAALSEMSHWLPASSTGLVKKSFTVTISVIAANVINPVNPGRYVGALLSKYDNPTFEEVAVPQAS